MRFLSKTAAALALAAPIALLASGAPARRLAAPLRPGSGQQNAWSAISRSTTRPSRRRPKFFQKEDVHAKAGFTCANCHGGDPTQERHGRGARRKKGFIGKPTHQQIPAVCAKMPQRRGLMKQFNPSLRVDELSEYKTSKTRADAGPGRPRTWPNARAVTAHMGSSRSRTPVRPSIPPGSPRPAIPATATPPLDGLLPPPLGRFTRSTCRASTRRRCSRRGTFRPPRAIPATATTAPHPGSLLRRQRLRNVPFRFAEKFKGERAFAGIRGHGSPGLRDLPRKPRHRGSPRRTSSEPDRRENAAPATKEETAATSPRPPCTRTSWR